MPKKKKKKKIRLKKSVKVFILIILTLTILLIIKSRNVKEVFKKVPNPFIKYENKIKEQKYNECIKNGITEDNFEADTITKKDLLENYLQKNNIRYYYHDITYNYDIKYKENEEIYGASLIKLPVALYLVDKEIDLSQTVKYEAKHKTAYSKGMEKHKIGDVVSLEELMKYSVTYSDNTAHHMLLDFIGKTEIKNYALGLGAKYIFNGWDDFGNQSASDLNIYLNKAYELFDTKPNGKLLKEYMNNDDTNALNFDENKFYHKYGSYSEYFHDTGIYISDKPYTVAVLTTKTESKGPNYVNEVSKLTHDFYKAYYTNIENYCHNEVYNEKD